MSGTQTSGDSRPDPAADRAVRALQDLVKTRPGGEVRPQQQTMVEHVAEAFASSKHLVVQAGTGVGKSYGYLVPAITSGQRVVVSTATKQLSEQIAGRDLPFLADHLTGPNGPVSYALLKGRDNYACLSKINDLKNLDEEAATQGAGAVEEALFEATEYDSRRPSREDLDRLNSLLTWAEDTPTGDRTDAPACSDQVWKQVSMTSTACPGATSCQFGEVCFAERARHEAKAADLVVTNHAMVATDMVSPGPMFADFDAIVFDEAHHVQEYLSRAWGLEVTASEMKHTIAEARRTLPNDDAAAKIRERMDEAVKNVEALDPMLGPAAGGVLKELPEDLADTLGSLRTRFSDLSRDLRNVGNREKVTSQANRQKASSQNLEAIAAGLNEFLIDSIDIVRWIEEGRGNKPHVLRTSPLWVGERLLEALDERTMIVTSATLAVGGDFEQTARVFGLLPHPDDYTALDVGTPFNYRTQAMLYIPLPNDFPAPVGQDRTAHTDAVKDELVDLVRAAGGRTLALFTTRYAADKAAEHLRSRLSTPVLAQGDAPPAQLIDQFAADESATICATMGFWHGVDVQGSSLSCVVIDKVPFAPMNEPLLKARMESADAEGRSGFNDIYVTDAATMIAQGFGRLVRSGTDRGVVAILDTRLRTKGYGKTFLRTLPDIAVFHDKAKVTGALGRLAAAADAAAGADVA